MWMTKIHSRSLFNIQFLNKKAINRIFFLDKIGTVFPIRKTYTNAKIGSKILQV